MNINDFTADLHQQIKNQSPLIHNITNYVVMNSSANILLACGASPVMAHSSYEVEEMASIANALVLNIGTLDKDLVQSMIKAGKKANELKIPVILDPVGSGATKLRTESAREILDSVDVSVLRGNASEIFSISMKDIKTRGVDSSISELTKEKIEASKEIAEKTGCILAVSGKQDIVTDGSNIITIQNGHEILTKITVMGCGLSAVIGAFCSVSKKNLLYSAAAGFIYYGVCAEITAEKTILPGSFSIQFIDNLYSVSKKQISEKGRAEILAD